MIGAVRSRSSRGSIVVALAVAMLGYFIAFVAGAIFSALIMLFAITALHAALARYRWSAWVTGLAALALTLWRAYGLDLVSAWQALVLAATAAAALYACTMYVRGHGVLAPAEPDVTTRWSRALVFCVSTLLIGGLAYGAVALAQRASGMARQSRAADEIEVAAKVVASELEDEGPPEREVPVEWEATLADAARLSGRSLLLYSPGSRGHELVLGAVWSSGNDPDVTIVRNAGELSAEEAAGIVEYLRDPGSSHVRRTWGRPVGIVPYGILVFDEVDLGPSADLVDEGGTEELSGHWVLVLVPPSTTEWWSAETSSEHSRQIFLFVAWALVIGAGFTSVMLRLADERMELLAKVRLAEEREAIRRDAHDRIYNRLAAVAHGLEQPGADGQVARGAAFEIRSAVDYLQTILRGETEPLADPRRVSLEQQLDEIAGSAERIWDIEVDLVIEPGLTLDPELAWDVQCLVDEALSNAGEHSGASRAVVMAEKGPDCTVRFSVTDNGSWHAPAAGRESTGLLGMRSRVEVLGGDISVTGGEDGTTVSISLPITSKNPRK